MVHNFGFLRGMRLAGSAHPGYGAALRSNLAEMARDNGITSVVSLSEDPLPEGFLEEYGLRGLHVPVVDFSVPTMSAMERGADFVKAELSKGGKVLVHCGAGYGRTGTFLACCLVAEGMSPQEAIRAVRQSRPGSLETEEQERFVSLWAEYRRQTP